MSEREEDREGKREREGKESERSSEIGERRER